MIVLNLPSNITYSNLYSLSGFPAGTSLIVTNNTATGMFSGWWAELVNLGAG